MGYEVKIVRSDLRIPAEKQPEVYLRWCKLNDPANDHLKGGGSYHGGVREHAWYSWMDEDYDKTCRTVGEILHQLGFEYTVGNGGDIFVTGYDSKTGQEELFFDRVSDLIDGSVEWEGEDGENFTWNFTKK
jgi:hypothetical protein